MSARAVEVVRYLKQVEATGDPAPLLVERARRALDPFAYLPIGGFAFAATEVAARIGWHRGGVGDHLMKALAIIESERDVEVFG